MGEMVHAGDDPKVSSASGSTLSERLAAALALIDEAIVDASARLKGQPDNPRIKRIGDPEKGASAFCINFSDVLQRGNQWDVFTHDWLAQYRYARELIETRRFGALAELLSTGSYRDRSHGRRSFAPEVIERVKAITGDLLLVVSLSNAVGLARASKAVEGSDESGAAPGGLAGPADENGIVRRHIGGGVVVETAEPRQLARRLRR